MAKVAGVMSSPGSPAIEAGDTTLTTDQRGTIRPIDAADDIGALEYLGPVGGLTRFLDDEPMALSALAPVRPGLLLLVTGP